MIYITGDNGASAEGTVHGAWSAPSFQNGRPEDPEWLLEHMDDFGTDRCENHFNVGWAWALDAPFQWMKQVASHFGGTRNAMALSWPARVNDIGGLRTQFHHVIDIVPTIYEAVGIAPPDTVNGIEQIPLHGTSMMYTFDAPESESTHTTQYFEILGNRGIYHDGWVASCFHGRVPWIRSQGFAFDGPQERWELYNVREDFSQSVDLAASNPAKLNELLALFDTEAQRYGVYPLRDAGSPRNGEYSVPHSLNGATKVEYTTAHVRMPESSVINIKNCSWTLRASVVVSASTSGVIVCHGGNMAGWSLYVDQLRHPVYHYNWYGHVHTQVRGNAPLTEGAHELSVAFTYDGGLGGGGDIVLMVDDATVDVGRLENTVPIVFSMSGETFDVGIDTGSPDGPYPHAFPLPGRSVESSSNDTMGRTPTRGRLFELGSVGRA